MGPVDVADDYGGTIDISPSQRLALCEDEAYYMDHVEALAEVDSWTFGPDDVDDSGDDADPQTPKKKCRTVKDDKTRWMIGPLTTQLRDIIAKGEANPSSYDC